MDDDKLKYNIDIDTLRVYANDGKHPYFNGSVTREIGGEHTDLISDYDSSWGAKTSSFQDAMNNILNSKKPNSSSTRLLMLIAIYNTMVGKYGSKVGLSSSGNLCGKTYIPVTGFTGMYVYFKLGITQDKVSLKKFTIDHDIQELWEPASKKYREMSKQIDGMPAFITKINKEYKKLKKLLHVRMEKN